MKKFWKMIDGYLYRYECYRTDTFDANNKYYDLLYSGGYSSVEQIYNRKKDRFDIFVRPITGDEE